MNKLTGSQLLTLLLVIQIVLINLISKFPEFIEQYYSNGLYPVISKLFRVIFGWIPFSVGDIYYFLLGLVLLISIVKLIRNRFRNWKEQLYRFGATLSILFFIFHFLWGMNYHRSSLFKTLEIEQRPYTLDELTSLSAHLLKKLKTTHLQLVANDSLKINVPYSKNVLISKTSSGYEQLAKQYPRYNYIKPSLKKSLYSLPLTYMGFSGYFNPFSGEAHVDHLVPKTSLPMINSHEVAHQIGFASESEANFIGYLAATKNKDPYFQFSANLMALRYTIGAIHYKDSTQSKKIIDSIPLGIKKNIIESQEFWRSYQNKLEPFFKLFYDSYLKANQQQDGMQSYSKMVNLLVAYQEKYGLE